MAPCGAATEHHSSQLDVNQGCVSFFFFLLKGTSAEQDACRSEPGVPIKRRGACKPLNWLLIRIKE